MGLKYAVVRSNITAKGGQQDFRDSQFSYDVSLAIAFWAGTGGKDDVSQGGAVLGAGMTDGSRQLCVSGWSGDALPDTVSDRAQFNDRMVQTHSASGGELVRGAATFIEDGVRLTWIGSGDRTPSRITMILFGGDGIVGEIQDKTLASAQDGTVSVTFNDIDLSDQGKAVVFALAADCDAYDSWLPGMALSFGAIVNDGSDSQASVGLFEESGSSAGDSAVYYGAARMAGIPGASATTYSVEGSDFTSTGLTLTSRDGAPGDDKSIFLAALQLSISSHVALDQITTPTSGTPPFDTDYTGLGFSANSGVIFCGTDSTADGYTDGANTSMSIGAWDTSTTGGVAISTVHASDPTDTNTYVADDIIVVDAAGNLDNGGSRAVTQHSDGYTVTWTTRADTNARKVWALALADTDIQGGVGVSGYTAVISPTVGIQGKFD